MTFGSLFAGIGGFDLGFERAGMRCVWQVEIDPYCRRVLAKHWPDVPKWDDVQTFTGEGFERPDVICGGFPCQDISLAGKGAGIDGDQSGLWSEFARIVRVVRPRYVVVENSPALLGRGMGRVVGNLAACGYDAEWDCIPAVAFGAPHERDRAFLVAHDARVQQGRSKQRTERKRTGPGRQPGEDANTDRKRSGEGRSGRAVAFCEMRQATGADADPHDTRRLEQRRAVAVFEKHCPPQCADWWIAEPGVVRVVHGVPNRVDRLHGLGNAVVPQVAEWIGRRLMDSCDKA